MEPEQQLDAIVQEYLKACASGQSPRPSEWLARYPDFAAELSAFFAGQKTAGNATTPLHSSPPMTAEQPTVAPGQTRNDHAAHDLRRRFGDYELLEEIARGAMGVVFKARQIS